MKKSDWIELRPDSKGKFDELVARNVELVHFEMMDRNCLWIGLDKKNRHAGIWIGSRKNGKLRIKVEQS